MTAETIIQSLASGLLMGLLYGLIAVGLSLIFGLMNIVNFAHGEFLMLAMYAAFFSLRSSRSIRYWRCRSSRLPCSSLEPRSTC